MEDIKPCVCGNERLYFKFDAKRELWSIECDDDDCPWELGWFATKKEAVEAWNARAIDEQELSVTLTSAQWEIIKNAVEEYCDEGPCCEGWQSERLKATSAALANALKKRGRDTQLLLCVAYLNTRATDQQHEDITGLAHELWALAQLMPEEGILDGVVRIEEALMGKVKGSQDPLMEKMAEVLEWATEIIHNHYDFEVEFKSAAEQALQEYRERKDAK